MEILRPLVAACCPVPAMHAGESVDTGPRNTGWGTNWWPWETLVPWNPPSRTIPPLPSASLSWFPWCLEIGIIQDNALDTGVTSQLRLW